MNAEEIHSEFYKALSRPNGWQSLKFLFARLKGEKEAFLWEVFFNVFRDPSHPDPQYRDQEAAGGFLWKLKPVCGEDPEVTIPAVLPCYDASVEELPWYFAEVFGIDRIRTIVKKIIEGDLADVDRRNANTFLYWLAMDPETMKAELNRKWNERFGETSKSFRRVQGE